jgi:hypothetical protein
VKKLFSDEQIISFLKEAKPGFTPLSSELGGQVT